MLQMFNLRNTFNIRMYVHLLVQKCLRYVPMISNAIIHAYMNLIDRLVLLLLLLLPLKCNEVLTTCAHTLTGAIEDILLVGLFFISFFNTSAFL